MRNTWIKLAMLVSALGWIAGCAHVEATKATFQHTSAALVLQIDRHMEEILRGPDIEEDQTLVLELRDYEIG